MHCERRTAEQVEVAEEPPLAALLAQLEQEDEPPALTGELASPLVRALVGKYRDATRNIARLENQVRKLNGELREANVDADRYEERVALLERHQKVSSQETEDALHKQLALVKAQREAMHAMSAPVIRVWRGVLVLPIIGDLDATRAASVTLRLLEHIQATRSPHVIVDLTGLASVDPATADHLIRLARSVRLLGARVTFTGIQPAVAQAFVGLGVDMTAMLTQATLEEALRRVV